jgi:hypothetical protein
MSWPAFMNGAKVDFEPTSLDAGAEIDNPSREAGADRAAIPVEHGAAAQSLI